jgi:hypothetical protein
MSKHQTANKYYWLLIGGSLLYGFLSLTAPIPSKNYNLSDASIRLLQLSLVVIIVFIYFIAFYGAIRFKNYALSIIKSRDGAALNQVSNGLLVLANGVLITSLFSSLRSRFIESGQSEVFTHVNQFLTIVFPLVAFYLIFRGARELVKISNVFQARYSPIIATILGVSVLGSILTYGLLRNPYSHSTPNPTEHNSYYLSDAGLLAFIVLPSILIWTFGALSVISINWYAQNVKGLIYRDSLKRLVRGLSAVILLGIMFSLLGTAAAILSNLSLGGVLAFIYVILIFYSTGYIIIASGAKKLALIEEV